MRKLYFNEELQCFLVSLDNLTDINEKYALHLSINAEAQKSYNTFIAYINPEYLLILGLVVRERFYETFRYRLTDYAYDYFKCKQQIPYYICLDDNDEICGVSTLMLPAYGKDWQNYSPVSEENNYILISKE